MTQLDSQVYDVLIVGGGLGGLALAIGLEQLGLDWQLCEAAEELRCVTVRVLYSLLWLTATVWHWGMQCPAQQDMDEYCYKYIEVRPAARHAQLAPWVGTLH
jgi:2-polyprenyl-6-methoxyphenol hydroxylase-like FAD-dependent oxidoreductase